ncbi:PIN domain-containing protein [candidate division CSSED10-310 bacterium]|uniref:Ribonuclease VapC n=1 Tax=candidate division CSSED10-310 bacterium TaxID=2855610 RepID=A0ABV6Z2Q7_UNCC1
MKALNTNILIRFLVKDDEQQAQVVYNTFKEAEKSKDVYFIPAVVLLETIWVLESVYNVARKEILDAIENLLLLPILSVDGQPAVRAFITSARKNRIDITDVLIACFAHYSGCESVLTFDKKAARFELFDLISG